MDRLELARRLGFEPEAARDSKDPLVVAETDPRRFAAAFGAAVASGRPVFLADPAWGPAERAEFASILALPSEPGEGGWLMIPSGGSGGRLKFARHDSRSLGAAVEGFRSHVGLSRVNAVGLLPLHHVSGLMAWLRAALSGGVWLPWEWKRIEAGERPPIDAGGWFLSLVPTQLQRLLPSEEARAWLRSFEAVFLGGGPLWPDLAGAARRARLPLAPSYGLTETAAMVAALRPEEFLGGAEGVGRPLPHAALEIGADGGIRLAGGSLFRGYYPGWRESGPYLSEDLGRLDEAGRLHVLGRRDGVIITGGKKVDPLEVESALRAGGQFGDVAVIGLADPEWGQVVAACYPAEGPAPDAARAASALSALAPFKRPRRYLAIPDWPCNAQGKLNRPELLRRAQAIHSAA